MSGTIGPLHGEKVHYLTHKAPLKQNGKIIGIIGVSLDISKEKELSEKLIKAEEKAKFVKIADQVAHDIRSPVASLLMIVKNCQDIPEKERIALREAALTIGDIANNLLAKYQKSADIDAPESAQPMLISAMLLQLLTEKRYQYPDESLTFDHDFSQPGYFAFVKADPTALKRAVSNIINNAVDAFDKKAGKVTLRLEANNEWVKIIVEDNGKGMSKSTIDKIMKNTAVTVGKSNGHGIGLAQVRETLQRYQGELSLVSEEQKGSTVTLTFSRLRTPIWAAEAIRLNPNDLVLILDDDKSIHGAWDSRFESVLKAHPRLQLKHFEQGNQALEFIQNLSTADKNRLFLLTDYELLNQPLNGLKVVAQGQVERSMLVTSHYANPLIQDEAIKTGTRILPKQLAAEIEISVNPLIQEASEEKADLILVEDDALFAQSLQSSFPDQNIVVYPHPKRLLSQLEKYVKDTPIAMDNSFGGEEDEGIELAKALHQHGYSKLYLLSGTQFFKQPLPEYLTAIHKTTKMETLKKRWFSEEKQ